MDSSHKLRLLSPGQRSLLKWVLLGAALLLADSVYLALAGHAGGVGDDPHDLPLTYQGLLVLHVIVGLLVFLPAVIFAFWHLPRARLRKTKGATPTGVLVLLLSCFLLVSGLFILTAANSRDNLWAFVGHQVAAILLPLVYLAHRMVSKDPPSSRLGIRWLGGMFLLLCLMGGLHALERSLVRKPVSATREPFVAEVSEVWKNPPIADPYVPFHPRGYVDRQSPFFPSATTTTTGGFLPTAVITHDDLPDLEPFLAETREKGFAPSHYLGAQSCVRCHQDIVEQWSKSAHRFASFNNPFYKKAVELTRETRSKQVSQWCGGCHDPAIMLAGNMTKDIDPATPESQAGLTCLACHAIDQIHNQTGNGNYNIQDALPSPYVFEFEKSGLAREIHDYVLKAKPNVHKRAMLKPVFKTSLFCATCHKVGLDFPVNGYRWFRGQNEYDAWHNSGVPHHQPMTWYEPADTKQCQDCHMPLEEAPLGDVSAKNGKVKSHRFLAANSALPHIRGDLDTIARTEAFLKDAKLRVDVFALHREDGKKVFLLEKNRAAVAPGEVLQVDVVVRNLGVGHTFPGGTNDSNEGWIDFQVRTKDRTIWRSGAVREDLQVDPSAHLYQAILVDKNSQRIHRRNPADIHATVYANVIPPSGSDIARYRFRLPKDLPEGEVEIVAELKWRKFNRTYTEFVFEGKPVPELPITRIAGHTIRLEAKARPETASQELRSKADWMRFNDYGIGLFLDGQTSGAAEAFAFVQELEPKRVDGYRNLARVYLRDGALDKAEAMMRKANDVAPEDPKLAFFWGQILEEQGRLDRAIEAYLRTLEVYPENRDSWLALGRTRWRAGRPKEAIAAYLEVLRIDPEDANAHYQRALCYRKLAADATTDQDRAAYEFAAAEAEKAFEKYKIDEDSQAKTLEYRQRHAHDNKMSQAIIIHEQDTP